MKPEEVYADQLRNAANYVLWVTAKLKETREERDNILSGRLPREDLWDKLRDMLSETEAGLEAALVDVSIYRQAYRDEREKVVLLQRELRAERDDGA